MHCNKRLASALECGGVISVQIIGGCHRKNKPVVQQIQGQGYHGIHVHIHALPSAQERRGCCKDMVVAHGFDDIHDKSQ